MPSRGFCRSSSGTARGAAVATSPPGTGAATRPRPMSDVEQSTGFWPVPGGGSCDRHRRQHDDSTPITVLTVSTPPDTTPPSTPVLAISEHGRRTRRFRGSTLDHRGSSAASRCRRAPADAELGIAQAGEPDARHGLDRALFHQLQLECGSQRLGSTNNHRHQRGGRDRLQQLHCHPRQHRAAAAHGPAAGATVQTDRRSPTSTDALSGVAQVEFRAGPRWGELLASPPDASGTPRSTGPCPME